MIPPLPWPDLPSGGGPPVFKFRDLFRPSMYMAADAYRRAHGPIDWEMDVVHHPQLGVALETTDGTGRILRTVVSEADIDRAILASLEWRYRLVAGPRAWKVRPLWLRRDFKALIRLFQKHAAIVFSPA